MRSACSARPRPSPREQLVNDRFSGLVGAGSSWRTEPGWRGEIATKGPTLMLGYLGIQPPSDIGTLIAQAGTIFYFGFFMLMPWWSRLGETKPVPERVNFAAH